MVLQVYTDASFSWERDIAACGFVILKDQSVIKHQVVLLERIKTIYHAEFWSIYNALCNAYLVKNISDVFVYSDNVMAINACKSRPKKMKWGKQSLFEDFYDLMGMFEEENINISFFKVKAHSGDRFNNMVDRSCLKHLREHLKKL